MHWQKSDTTDSQCRDQKCFRGHSSGKRIGQINLDLRLVTDPWDTAYQFLNIENSTTKGKGGLRKDKFLNPLNSDYDLYSSGKDKDSKGPLTAKASHDDIVRARNGGFVGLATDF